MASFAERMGRRAVRSLVQSDDLDLDTRTEVWNVVVVLRQSLEGLNAGAYVHDNTGANVLSAVWAWEFRKARDEMRSSGEVWQRIKDCVLGGEWFDALDLVEALMRYLDRFSTTRSDGMASTFCSAFNSVFERYLVGYRFIGLELTPVDSDTEADAVREGLAATRGFDGARHALERAVALLADRQNPDYANSMKESISAVESVVKKITGSGDLGAGLRKLEDAGLTIHPALKAAWLKMYGYTSDEDGVRHGGIDAASVDQALAKYLLIVCSAFVSYLIEEGRKVELV